MTTEIEHLKAELQSEIERLKAQLQQANWREQAEWQCKLEAWKAEQAQRLETFKFHQSEVLSLAKAQIDFALASLRMSFLINGGAIVALLALLGQLWRVRDPTAGQAITTIAPSFVAFIAGIVCATAAAALSYVSQSIVVEKNTWKRTAFGTRLAAVLLVLGAMSLFCVGAWKAFDGIRDWIEKRQITPASASAPDIIHSPDNEIAPGEPDEHQSIQPRAENGANPLAPDAAKGP
jgi:hypothetical protein